jgi:SAM-dependent methyltransferase
MPKFNDAPASGSLVDPSYSRGLYFADSHRHGEDADFKAGNFLRLFLRFAQRHRLNITSFADVGCGSGDIAKIIADSLRANGMDLQKARGYDVSPHVLDMNQDGVEYIHADFCRSDESVDVVTLFDVFEHVPDTVAFIKAVSRRCKVVGFHIPLDYSFNVAARNKFRRMLVNPGHLIFMDTTGALNLLALSGLRVVDYEYTFGFLSPSGHRSLLSKVVLPLRFLMARVSPWLLSKTMGGASLMVIAVTPRGSSEIQFR